nr:MBL fold metallo-hydrolase [Acidobacteriota bacterium]
GLRRVFYYIFEREHIGGGLAQIIPNTIEGEFEVCGLRATPFDVVHGKLAVTGFRFSDGQCDVAFITDCNSIPEASLAKLHRLDLLIIDALRFQPHATHLHLDQTLDYIARLKPRRALLTHMGHDFKHAELARLLPAGVEPAYDGLRLEI